MSAITHLPATASTDEICDILERDAALIIDDVLSADQVRQIRAELAPFLEAGGEGRDEFSGFATKRIGALIARSPECRKLALDPIVNSTAAQYLAPHAEGYQLHFTQAVNIGPGESAQP
ncbi:MAG: phytanoyl-CoA dioxygenase family protein, partial [Erythrobacter sp.]|nr:phytanoyl-CoA dioxygenase family protein [Erythrobacter sp.]